MRLSAWIALLPMFAAVVAAMASPTLDSIRKTQTLTCGIDQSEAEYSTMEEHGSRFAFDNDLCRAVAIAILGPNGRIAIKGYPDGDTALLALQRKEIDLVASVSDDFSHRTLASISLTTPVLFDREALMVRSSVAITHAAELTGKKICFLDQTETEINLRRWFKQRRLDFIPFPFQEEGEMEAAFVTSNCAALAGDITRLANARVAFGSSAKDYTILGDTIALDPVAMAYRSNDSELGNILQWTINVLLRAEEIDINSNNIHHSLPSQDLVTMRLLGMTHELGRPLGLRDDWPLNVLQIVGNYAEIYERDLGDHSPLKISRGEDRLWTDGGLLYALPLK